MALTISHYIMSLDITHYETLHVRNQALSDCSSYNGSQVFPMLLNSIRCNLEEKLRKSGIRIMAWHKISPKKSYMKCLLKKY
jgi:hypothetical protein